MQLKKHAFDFRLDADLKLQSNTINFILQGVKSDSNIGFDSQRKDFLEVVPKGETIEKV